MRRISLALVCFVALVTACSQPAVRQKRGPGVYGTVIGSIFIQLEQEKQSAWGGFFDEDLYTRRPDFVFHFGSRVRNWGVPTERVKFELGKPKPFVIALRPGPASLEELELVVYHGPAGWLFGALSTVDGETFPIDLEFDVDPRRITYIGRIHVVLPRRLPLTGSEAKISVEDAAAEDRASLDTLISLSRLPVTTVLAQRGRAE
jgi:hypothetical protein